MLKTIYIILLSAFAIPNAVSSPRITVELLAGMSEADRAVRADLVDAQFDLEVDRLLNGAFKFNRSLALVFGSDDGPLYDSELSRIQIPYSFISETKQLFSHADDSAGETNIEEAVMDALLHTVLHELTHALIDMYELPVTGKEEDAADDLASLLLISQFEDGQERAWNAADLFMLESLELGELNDQDLQAEHSIEEQRYFRVLCQIYGSDPDNYSELIEQADFSEERAELCLDDYVRSNNAWVVLLTPIMRSASQPILSKK